MNATVNATRSHSIADRPDHHTYLDPAVLARIGTLELRTRLVVQGFLAGMHRSPYRGLAVEFASHREYVQGDDSRHIDWKVFARTNKYYIKEYEQETNLYCLAVVDASESMHFKSDRAPLSKYDYAASLAASLTYLAILQHDAAGVALFDDRVRRFVRPSNSPTHWRAITSALTDVEKGAKTSIRDVLNDLADRLRHRHLIILISDLFDDPAETLRGLKRLRHHRHELIVCHVLDETELTFPFTGPTRFEGLEQTGHLTVEPEALKARYLEALRHFTGALRDGCRQMRIDFATFSTATPLDVGISAYLATRNRNIRQRSSRVLGRR